VKEEDRMIEDAQRRMAIGAALASIAALGIVLSAMFGWSGASQPWGFLLGLVLGIVVGLGATLTVSGLIEYRRERQ
jgi:F0F1-type ATP synthase assembly protein I